MDIKEMGLKRLFGIVITNKFKSIKKEAVRKATDSLFFKLKYSDTHIIENDFYISYSKKYSLPLRTPSSFFTCQKNISLIKLYKKSPTLLSGF